MTARAAARSLPRYRGRARSRLRYRRATPPVGTRPRQTRRLLALAAVYDGMSREAAAAVGGMDRQTLRDWVHRFNAEGPDGLTDRPRSGMPRRLSEAQMQELAGIVETGPNPVVDGVVRWRRIDLQRVIEERFGVVYSERAITDLLKALAFSYISGRPKHPGQDARVLEAFKNVWPVPGLQAWRDALKRSASMYPA